MCDWVTLLYSRKLTEHCKPIIKKKIKNHFKIKKVKKTNAQDNLYIFGIYFISLALLQIDICMYISVYMLFSTLSDLVLAFYNKYFVMPSILF